MGTLKEIGTRHRTDKVTVHKFTGLYEDYYSSFRNDKVKILEIGIYMGASLKTWHEYFPNGMIYGIDDCSITDYNLTPEFIKKMENDRIKTFIGDQSNREHLKKFIDEHGGDFDTIIDDGYHFQAHQQVSLGFLFPYVKSKGIYVVEDLCPRNRTKEGWGLKDFVNFSDNTNNVLYDFATSRKILSPYMTENEMIYLNNHIEYIKIYVIENDSNIIAFIKKKALLL